MLIVSYLHRISYVVFVLEKGSSLFTQRWFENQFAVVSFKLSSCIITWVTACTVTAKMLFVITVTGSAYMYRYVVMPWKRVNCCWYVSAPPLSYVSITPSDAFLIWSPTFSDHCSRENFGGASKHVSAGNSRLPFKEVLVESALVSY